MRSMGASGSKKAPRTSHLRLVHGSRSEAPHIAIAPRSRQPFPVEALILEEDTFLALSAPPEVREPRTHPVRTFTEAWAARPLVPGSVLVRAGHPLRILAVVHDLSLHPSWRVEWIEGALELGLDEAQRHGLRVLGIEPLGALHGRFPCQDFDALLDRLLAARQEPPRAVWRIEPHSRRRG